MKALQSIVGNTYNGMSMGGVDTANWTVMSKGVLPIPLTILQPYGEVHRSKKQLILSSDDCTEQRPIRKVRESVNTLPCSTGQASEKRKGARGNNAVKHKSWARKPSKLASNSKSLNSIPPSCPSFSPEESLARIDAKYVRCLQKQYLKRIRSRTVHSSWCAKDMSFLPAVNERKTSSHTPVNVPTKLYNTAFAYKNSESAFPGKHTAIALKQSAILRETLLKKLLISRLELLKTSMHSTDFFDVTVEAREDNPSTDNNTTFYLHVATFTPKNGHCNFTVEKSTEQLQSLVSNILCYNFEQPELASNCKTSLEFQKYLSMACFMPGMNKHIVDFLATKNTSNNTTSITTPFTTNNIDKNSAHNTPEGPSRIALVKTAIGLASK